MGAPSSDVIRLGSPKKSSSFKQKATSFLTKAAVFEAGVLGTLLGGPIGGLKAAGATGLGLGILQTSQKARKAVVAKVKDPLSGGRFIGGLIEGTDKKVKDKGVTLTEKIKEGAKKAGLIGAIGAGAVGLGVATKAVAEKVKKARLPKQITAPSILTKPVSSVIGSTPLGAPAFSSGTPLAPARTTIPDPIPLPKEKPQKAIRISNKVNVNIDNRSKASNTKKFINKIVLPIK